MKRGKTVRIKLENEDIIVIKLNEKIVVIEVNKVKIVDAYIPNGELNQIKSDIRYEDPYDEYSIYNAIMNLPLELFQKTTQVAEEGIVQINIMESSQNNGRWICVHCFKTHKDEAEKLLKYWENL